MSNGREIRTNLKTSRDVRGWLVAGRWGRTEMTPAFPFFNQLKGENHGN
jgi:hypothetical protein